MKRSRDEQGSKYAKAAPVEARMLGAATFKAKAVNCRMAVVSSASEAFNLCSKRAVTASAMESHNIASRGVGKDRVTKD